MIPLHLSLQGFLSYRDPVQIDFTQFSLACIAGSNGSGKSSLLDAFTWVLFGAARKRDDSIINAGCDTAEVRLLFAYEGNIYRVQRSKTREKTTWLEFHILQDLELTHRTILGQASPVELLAASWKSLTERALRDTDQRIQDTLRLDYETFVNASFFLQGKADQFTQQRPGDRKRILGSILGLETWENYRQRASERRRGVEADLANLDGRLAEISAELAEESERRARLERLQSELERLSRARLSQQDMAENARRIKASLIEQHRLVEILANQLNITIRQLDELEKRLATRQAEKENYTRILGRASEIEAAYAAWQSSRAELERWDEIAGRFREHEKLREAPRNDIQKEQVRLEEESRTLQNLQRESEAKINQSLQLGIEASELAQEMVTLNAHLAERPRLEEKQEVLRQRQSDANAENPRLKAEMDQIKERIDRLTAVESPQCPLCGQPLSSLERQNLIEALTNQGTELGNRYRLNLALVKEADNDLLRLKSELSELSQQELKLRNLETSHAQKIALQGQLQAQYDSWRGRDLPRLNEVQHALAQDDYASAARLRLAEIDAGLKEIGYDAVAHDAARKAESTGRTAEAALRQLETARATLVPLEREIASLEEQIANQRTHAAQGQSEYDQAATALSAAEATAPDLKAAERLLNELVEQENHVRQEVGAARQKVDVLDNLKERRKRLEIQREELAILINQYKQLERAFGKDGVPALLIEQALPQIEAKANEVLDRLSGSRMAVRFITQAAYKDKGRADLRETLDIQISDSSGTRDYEMYSGGEAFRVNFAIRLALSEVLAQRAGARLQTLVIDEGFGSQDNEGRQRLVEAINSVKGDFAKILVITHIEELKDQFPTRIEVEKTSRGSQVTII